MHWELETGGIISAFVLRQKHRKAVLTYQIAGPAATYNISTHLILQHMKLKVRVKFTIEQVTKGQRGSRGIALLFL